MYIVIAMDSSIAYGIVNPWDTTKPHNLLLAHLCTVWKRFKTGSNATKIDKIVCDNQIIEVFFINKQISLFKLTIIVSSIPALRHICMWKNRNKQFSRELWFNLFTTKHDGNFRRHSSMNVTIKWHTFSSNIYYIYVFFVIWSWKLR